MKLLIDMNLAPRWVEYLRAQGIEADHWSTLGSAEATDAAILEFAAHEGYTILTRDLDFGYLMAKSEIARPSVVLIRMHDMRPESIGSVVIATLRRFSDQIEVGGFVSLGEEKQRVRVFPFGKDEKDKETHLGT